VKGLVSVFRRVNRRARDEKLPWVRVLLMNACNSYDLAVRLAEPAGVQGEEGIEFVIGHEGPVEDKTALLFSKTFYDSLAKQETLHTSFTESNDIYGGGYRLVSKMSNPEKMLLNLRCDEMSDLTKATKIKYFCYVIIRPAAVVTWHNKHREGLVTLVKDIERMFEKKAQNLADCPIYLTDDSRLTMGKYLHQGGSRSLILSAMGRGWEPSMRRQGERCSPFNYFQDLKEIFCISGWLHVIIVCQTYGAESAAKVLWELSGTKTTVLWFRQEFDATVCEIVLDFLQLSPRKSKKDIKQDLLEGHRALSSKPDPDNFFDILKDEDYGDVGTAVDNEGTVFKVVNKVSELVVQHPHLWREPDENFELKTCDLRDFRRLIDLVSKHFDKSARHFNAHRILVPGKAGGEPCLERCRSIAFQVCTYFKFQQCFDCVLRVRSRKHCNLPQVKLGGLLVWFDLCDANCDAQNIDLSTASRRFALVTYNDASADVAEVLETKLRQTCECVVCIVAGALKSGDELTETESSVADKLHRELRLTLLDEKDKRCSCQVVRLEYLAQAVKEVLESFDDSTNLCFVPISSLFVDDDDAVLVRVCFSDVRNLNRLRDMVLSTGESSFESTLKTKLASMMRAMGVGCEQKEIRVVVDKTRFAEDYEESMRKLEQLTPHQQKMLSGCPEGKSLHVMAPAGAGKTYVALHLMWESLSRPEAEEFFVLFVANHEAMAVFVSNWICSQINNFHEIDRVLKRLHLLFPSSSSGDKECVFQVWLDKHLETSPVPAAASYDMIVVDEAHYLYSRDAALSVQALRGFLETLTDRSKSPRLVLLSDVSQSDGRNIDYPRGLHEMRLEEVIRSTQRIVAGASAFQLGGVESTTTCKMPPGLPLLTFIFLDSALYATKVVEALEAVVGMFPDLSLHNRLAIIVPDSPNKSFLKKEQLQTSIMIALGASTLKSRKFDFVTARKAAGSVGSRITESEWLVYDTVSAMDGLERLIVVGVGLDVEGSASTAVGNDPRMALDVRSSIYRAMTRAQMMFLIVNQWLSGGWLEYLLGLELDPDGNVMEEAERTRRAARSVVHVAIEYIEADACVAPSGTRSSSNEDSAGLFVFGSQGQEQEQEQEASRLRPTPKKPARKSRQEGTSKKSRQERTSKQQPKSRRMGQDEAYAPGASQPVVGESSSRVSEQQDAPVGDDLVHQSAPALDTSWVGHVSHAPAKATSSVWNTKFNDVQTSSAPKAYNPHRIRSIFRLSGDLVSRKSLSVDIHQLKTVVPSLIAAKDRWALYHLTSIEYVAAKAFAGGLHALLRELADAVDGFALPQGSQQAVEGVRRFVGKHLSILRKPPMPSAVFQLALQEPDDSSVCRGAAEFRGQFNGVEWLNKPQGLDPCVMRLGFQSPVKLVAFSPDGKLLATACGAEVIVSDKVTGELVGTLKGHSGVVWSVAWNHDGSQLASGSSDCTVRLWTPDGKEKGTLKGTIASWQHLDAETKALAAKVKKGGSAGGNRTGQYIVTAESDMVYVYVATSDGQKQGGPLASFRSPAFVQAVVCRGTSVVAGCQGRQVLFLEAPLLAVG